MAAATDALLELHALLEPAQRVAVADALHARIAEKRAERERDKSGFKRVAAHLMLSAMQVDKLKALRDNIGSEPQRLHPRRREVAALIDAFKTEAFADSIEQFEADKRAILRERLADGRQHADTAMAILSDGQRDLLADLIERGPKAVLLEERSDG
jgi:hypothetical protein